MTTVKTFAWICLAAAAGRVDPQRPALPGHPRAIPGIIATVFLFGSFAAAVVTLISLQGLPGEDRQVQAVGVGPREHGRRATAQVGLLIDPLALFMMLVVSGVSTLIHLYAVRTWTPTAATRGSSAT